MLLTLLSSSSSSLGTERSAEMDVQTSSSTSNNLFLSFGSSMLEKAKTKLCSSLSSKQVANSSVNEVKSNLDQSA